MHKYQTKLYTVITHYKRHLHFDDQLVIWLIQLFGHRWFDTQWFKAHQISMGDSQNDVN